MKRFAAIGLLFFLVAGFASWAGAAPVYPEPRGYVNDFASVMSPGERSRLEALVREVREKAAIEIALVTMDTIPEGQDISLYAVELGHQWGVGAREDRGALLLYKTGRPDGQRQVYLATGYGLEGEIPDARAGQILDEVTIPYLRDGRVFEGFAATALVVTNIVEPDVKLTGVSEYSTRRGRAARQEDGPGGIPLIIMLVIVALMMTNRTGRAFLFGMLLSSMFSGRGGGGWGGGGGGGFGGGFGGFGGGGFGGGGAGRSF